MVEQEAISFEDSENWRASKVDNFREICMAQIKRITTISSTEFRSGWWKKSIVSPQLNYEIETQYFPDTREAYSNAVEVLHDLLAPKFDKEMEKEAEKVNLNLQICRKKNQNEEYSQNEYRFKRRLHYRRMFQALCKFLERLGWLEGLEITD